MALSNAERQQRYRDRHHVPTAVERGWIEQVEQLNRVIAELRNENDRLHQLKRENAELRNENNRLHQQRVTLLLTRE